MPMGFSHVLSDIAALEAKSQALLDKLDNIRPQTEDERNQRLLEKATEQLEDERRERFQPNCRVCDGTGFYSLDSYYGPVRDRHVCHEGTQKPQPQVEVKGPDDFRKDMRLVYYVDDAAVSRALIAPDLKRLEKARRKAERNPRKPATDLIDWLARPLEDMMKGITNAFRWIGDGIEFIILMGVMLLIVGLLGGAIDRDGRKLTAQRHAAVESCQRTNSLRMSQAHSWEDYAHTLRNAGKGHKADRIDLVAASTQDSIIDCERLTD